MYKVKLKIERIIARIIRLTTNLSKNTIKFERNKKRKVLKVKIPTLQKGRGV